MKMLYRQWFYTLAAIGLAACQPPAASGLTPTVLPPTPGPVTAVTATFPVPGDFSFSRSLVNALIQSGVEVQSVGPSLMSDLFDVPRLAVLVQTDQGIIEAVYLDNPTEASVISVVPFENSPEGQYLYEIQALPPLLDDDRVIDSAYPLYHLIHEEMLIQTASEDLHQILVEALDGS